MSLDSICVIIRAIQYKQPRNPKRGQGTISSYQGFVVGVNYVGEQFSLGEMFLPHLVLGGKTMKAAVAVLEPEMAKRGTERQMLGKVVLGTVEGDIHDICGKSRPTQRRHCALLATTMVKQKHVIEAIDDLGLRPKVRVMVGDAPVTGS